ncbi:MAG: hypothetical protein H7A23_23520 [Leptospiraceae bacterium]|nr:hypothetical protein [Leptospiraceae bacterium]MCP5497533.1 hypothetical protein [Leptospiraceae bacterium]
MKRFKILTILFILFSFWGLSAANVLVLESKKMMVDVKTTTEGNKVIVEKKDGSKEEYDADKVKVFPVPTTWGDKKEETKESDKNKPEQKEEKEKKEEKKPRDKLSLIIMGVWVILWFIVP